MRLEHERQLGVGIGAAALRAAREATAVLWAVMMHVQGRREQRAGRRRGLPPNQEAKVSFWLA